MTTKRNAFWLDEEEWSKSENMLSGFMGEGYAPPDWVSNLSAMQSSERVAEVKGSYHNDFLHRRYNR